MATTWPLTVEIDVPEPRVELDRLVVSAGGAPDSSGWDMHLSSGVWQDPVTRTCMLAPLPVTGAWASTVSGNYARLAKASYTLTTSAAWVENHRVISGNIFLEGNGTNELVRTTATYSANQPFYLEVFVPGVQSLGDQTILKCGWGVPAAAGTVELRFRASGQVTIHKGSEVVAVYDRAEASAGELHGASTINQATVPILLLPCRGRELLVVTGLGTKFSHAFADLDPDSTSNTITAASYFWWQVPIGRPSVLCAPVHFETAGTLYGPTITLRYAPDAPRTFSDDLIAHGAVGPNASVTDATVSLVDATTLAAYTPDGTTTEVRVAVDFTSGGDASDGVYAVDIAMPGTTVDTADEAVDITQEISSLTLSLDEDGRVTGQMQAFDPGNLDALGMDDSSGAERTIRIALGSVDIFRGTVGRPRWVSAEGEANGIGDRLEWPLVDRSKEFELYTFADTDAYDNLLMTDAIERLFVLPGFDVADRVITTDTFQLPFSPAVSLGEWELIPQRGDTVAQWIDKIHADYAATWVKGWVPTLSGYKWQFRDPADFGTTPHLTIYCSRDDADGAGVSQALFTSRTVRAMTRWRQDPEANQILVVGLDKRTRRFIYSQYDDAASQDPTTVKASRPTNWRGRVVRYQLIEPSITTQAAADRAVDILTERLTTTRDYIEWESDILVRDSDDRPLWSGDVVRIIEPGTTSTVLGDYRIIAIPTMEFQYEALSGEVSIRRAIYRGLKIA